MHILLIIEPLRQDLYAYIAADTVNEYSILWKHGEYNSEKGASFITHFFSFEQFSTPYQALKTIKPDRVIFFEIIDLHQIALCIAVNDLQIPSVFVDHGFKTDSIAEFFALYNDSDLKPFRAKTAHAIRNIGAGIRSRKFYLSSAKGLKSKSFIPFLRLLYHLPRKHPVEALHRNMFMERTPPIFALFCRHNINLYDYYYGARSKQIVLTGNPLYDKFKSPQAHNTGEKYLVYIDGAFLETNTNKWTTDFHRFVAQTLNKFATSRKIKIFVKLHPRSNMALWESYEMNVEYIALIQTGDYTSLYLGATIILSHYSSLLMAFIPAKINVVHLGWHPEARLAGSDFDKYNLMHISLRCEELEADYSYWERHNLAQSNTNDYNAFIEEYNSPFDGAATQRILNVITGISI